MQSVREVELPDVLGDSYLLSFLWYPQAAKRSRRIMRKLTVKQTKMSSERYEPLPALKSP